MTKKIKFIKLKNKYQTPNVKLKAPYTKKHLFPSHLRVQQGYKDNEISISK